MRIAFLLAFLVLQGCSVSRLAYNNVDVVLRWQMDHYFDLEGDQTDLLDRGLTTLLAWHRNEALPQYARLARSSVLAVRDVEFVDAARAVGSSALRIVVRHVLPNILAPLLVQATLGIATAELEAAGV